MENNNVVMITGEMFNTLLGKLEALQERLNQKTTEDLTNTYLESIQVQTMLGISAKTLSNWRDRGIIGFHQIGAKIWFKRAEVDKLMEAHHIKKVN